MGAILQMNAGLEPRKLRIGQRIRVPGREERMKIYGEG
jgi:hypothetical protein